MEAAYLLCRTFGHNWAPYTAREQGRGRARLFEVGVRCPRCTTVRHLRVNGLGEIVGGRYDYPDGYLLEGLGRIAGDSRAALRLVSMTNLVDSGLPAYAADELEAAS
jgi:hypothetical protein